MIRGPQPQGPLPYAPGIDGHADGAGILPVHGSGSTLDIYNCHMHQSSSPAGPTDEQRIESAARGLLRGIGRLSQTLFRTGDFGLGRSQVAVLDSLEDGPRRVTVLAAHTGMAQPRVTVVLQGLEERGLATRERRAADRRVVEASLTPAGRELLDRGVGGWPRRSCEVSTRASTTPSAPWVPPGTPSPPC